MVSILDTAILALDAYNRDGAGLNLGTGPIGTFALLDEASSGAFYAAAYTRGSEVVISYRGTDGNYIGDIWTGWGQSTGFLTSQAEAAAAFYQQVNGGSIAPNLHITLTGHSLGGGMAGFIGALYGVGATVFDNINFLSAANNAWEQSRTQELLPGIYGPQNSLYRELFYGGAEPPLAAPDADSIGGAALIGEIAYVPRGIGNWQPTPISHPFLARPDELHDMALLVMTLWAKALPDQTWQSSGLGLLDALFSDAVAEAVAPESDSTTMRTKIAYSIVEDGTKPFGNVAIKALFNDAHEIAKVYEDSVNPILDSYLTRNAFFEIATQYAADLAEQRSENQEFLQGAIQFSTSQGLLVVDLDPDKWVKSSTDDASNIVGRDNLVDALLSASGADASKWGATAAQVTKIVIATGSDAVNLGALDAPNLKNDSPGAAILVGGEGDDQLWGGLGKDVLIGGDGEDLIRGGDGEDLLVGGEGSDTIVIEIVEGSTGEDEGDTIFGGEGADKFVLGAVWAARVARMYGRRPRCKKNLLVFAKRSGASMYPAC